MLGLPEITTKKGETWRPREELAREALISAGHANFAEYKQTAKELTDDTVLVEAYKSGRIILVGPNLFLKHFQSKSRSDVGLNLLMDKWVELSLCPGKASKKDRKEQLDDIETKIALALKRRVKSLDYLNTRKSPHAKQAIARLLARYPLIFDILNRTSGKASITFFEGLLSSEQMRLL